MILVPPPPINLSPVSVGSDSAKVRWTFIPSNSFRGNLHSYKLQYYEQGMKKQTLKHIENIPVSVFVGKCLLASHVVAYRMATSLEKSYICDHSKLRVV